MNIWHRLQRLPMYLLSFPERLVRTAAALGGGLVHETASVLLPLRLRHTKLYQATVDRLLRIVTELVGDVQGVFPEADMTAEQLLARKTAGNVVETASFLAVGWSPVWLLAAASDLLNGTRAYLRVLVIQLQKHDLLPTDVVITSFEELLNALEQTSGTLADAIDVPPLNVADLRLSWNTLRKHAGDIPDTDRLATIFIGLQLAAQREDRSLLEMSAVLALGAVRAGLELGNTHIFDYYRSALQTILDEGLLIYLQRVIRPYRQRAVDHLSGRSSTLTEKMLRNLITHKSSPDPDKPPSDNEQQDDGRAPPEDTQAR